MSRCVDACQPSTDPRHTTKCVKCGRTVDPPPPEPTRKHDFERDFIEGAERIAGLAGLEYYDHVAARLTEGQVLYGDAALGRSLAALKREILDEGLDLGTWSVLTAQSRDMEALDDDRRQAGILKLQEVASKGAEVEALLREFSEIVAP